MRLLSLSSRVLAQKGITFAGGKRQTAVPMTSCTREAQATALDGARVAFRLYEKKLVLVSYTATGNDGIYRVFTSMRRVDKSEYCCMCTGREHRHHHYAHTCLTARISSFR